MDTHLALPLLGGLTPQQFMRRHWQKKPLLVRQAVPGFKPLLTAGELMALAAREDVESRLIVQQAASAGRKNNNQPWLLKKGPLSRRAIPSLRQPGWTLLVQGVDLHHPGAHDFLQSFRFLPDARLDDLMVSLAADGGGVGPHFDSYDVFLFQASGSRRWQISDQNMLELQADVPLKILREFQPSEEFVLHAGDMLYLPPRYAHDGVAVPSKLGPCMTYSIGFRAPTQAELAAALLQRLGDWVADTAEEAADRRYRDPRQTATESPAQMPAALSDFARQALKRALSDPGAMDAVLGEYLTEPKASVWFTPGPELDALPAGVGLALHPCTRMLYDARHVFINGESLLARGADARLMRRLADARQLSAKDCARASFDAHQMLCQWLADGWVVLREAQPSTR